MRAVILGIIGFAFCIVGCSLDPNENANKLFVESTKMMNSIKENNTSYSHVLNLYKNVLENIDTITSRYSSSSVAVSLLSEQTKISNFTISELQGLESKIEQLVKMENDLLYCALFLVETLESNTSKISQYIDFSDMFIQTGDKKMASQMLSKAYDLSLEVEGSMKLLYMSLIVEKYVEIGLKENAYKIPPQALNVVESFDDSLMGKANDFGKVAVMYANVGQKKEAIAIMKKAHISAEAVKYDTLKNLSMTYVAKNYAKSGLIDQALKVMGTLKTDKYKAGVLESISAAYMKTNDISKAIETTNKIELAYNKASALSYIAGIHTDNERIDKAASLLDQALKVTNNIDDAYESSSTLSGIADVYRKLGKKEVALQVLSEALTKTEKIEADSYYLSSMLRTISFQYVKLGMPSKSLDVIRLLNKKDSEAMLTMHIHAESGEYDKSLEITKGMSVEEITYALGDIAKIYTKTKHVPSDKELRTLREIVHMLYPTRLLWK